MTLPPGWAEATIGDLGDFLNGMAFKPTDWGDAGIGIIRIQNLTDARKPLNRTQRSFSERYRIVKGNLLVSWSATLDAFIWDREDAVLNQHIFKVTPSACVDERFLFFQLRQSIADLFASEHLHGSTMKHINRGPFLAHRIALPPLAEQRRIVVKLDALTARLARARTDLARIPALAEKMRREVLNLQLERFANAPVIRISQLCKVGTGATPLRGDKRYYENGDVPWVTSTVVNQSIVMIAKQFITKTALTETNCKIFPAGSLMVAMYGEGKTRGKVTKLGIAAATNQALAVLHEFDKARIDSGWLRAQLQHRYEVTRAEAAGGVQPNLSLGIIKAIGIVVPDVETQRDAIAAINTIFARADCLEVEAVRAAALLDRMEAAILASAFRGELVPQDPGDEPASELIARIRAARAAAPPARRGRRPVAA